MGLQPAREWGQAMRRGIRSFMVVLVVVLLPVFWLFRPPTALPARFAHEDCSRVALTDTVSGLPLIGVEDLELLPGGKDVILSATDRLAVEWRPSEAPNGGIYEVSVQALANGTTWAQPIVYPSMVGGELFPQGVAISGDGERMAFVNRNRDGRVSIVGGRRRPGGFDVTASRDDPMLCRANDLAFTGDGPMELRITLDRIDCGVSWQDLKPGSTSGRVVKLNLESVAEPEVDMTGLSFANGIAGMYVAETRAERLRHRLDLPLMLPGGPDNLTYDPLGGLIVALHPSMLRIGTYRFGYRDNAPSRIVRVDLDRQIEVLFDDPLGEVFSGATAAIYSDGVLVLGSVRDHGVLVCQKAAQ